MSENADDPARRNALGQFGPGNTASPGVGRPKGSSVKKHIQKLVEQLHEETGRTKGELLAEVLVAKGLQGEDKAIEMLLRRFWPEKQVHEYEMNDGEMRFSWKSEEREAPLELEDEEEPGA